MSDVPTVETIAHCPCGRPLAVTFQRLYGWIPGREIVGPWEHSCTHCAPARTACKVWTSFFQSGQDAEVQRQEDIARAAEGRARLR